MKALDYGLVGKDQSHSLAGNGVAHRCSSLPEAAFLLTETSSKKPQTDRLT